MELVLFTLCDYASNAGGRLSIINTLDTITAERFPWRAYFGFALKGNILHNQPQDTVMRLTISHSEERDKYLFDTSSPVPTQQGRFAAAGNIRGIIFSRPGKYIFRVETNHGLLKEYPFTVKTKPDGTDK